MGNRGRLLIVMLVLFWVAGTGVADEPVNISMFDPDTFQIPLDSGPEHENLTVFSLVSEESKKVHGTGNLSTAIVVTDPSGDRSESALQINGSDETSWSYSTSIYNSSPYSYTIIDLSVANADRVWAHTISSANEHLEVAESEVDLDDDVDGVLFFGSVFPTDPDYHYMKGPETIMILMDISGSGYVADVARHYNQRSASAPRGTAILDQIRSARADEIAAITDSDLEVPNLTEIRGSSLTLLGDVDYPLLSYSYMDMEQPGTVGYREGFCRASAEEVGSGQDITGVTASSLSLESSQVRDNEDNDMYITALSGRNVTSCSYVSSNYDTGVSGRLNSNYRLSADSRSEFTETGYVGNAMSYDNIQLRAPVDESSDTSTMLTGDHTLVIDGASSSLTGTYEGSAPRIRHIGSGMGKTSQGRITCTIGDVGTTSMATLKGYVQTRGSSVSAGSASTQNLFYVDAERGVPMEWVSRAANDDEGVMSTGSSNAGSQFIRQKAYADRSTLIAT